MKIYNYDPQTHEHIGTSQADPDPMLPDHWLVPAYATTLKPPLTEEKKIAVFVDDQWIVRADFRGVQYWLKDGSLHTIDRIDISPPENALFEPPVSVKQKRLSICRSIDATAGAARTRFATNSAFIESEYQRAYTLAVEWINSGYQGEAPTPVRSDAEAFGRTDQEAAQYIKATGDYWFSKLDEIRDIRLKGKQAVEQAGDDADFMAVAQPFIDQLEALKP